MYKNPIIVCFIIATLIIMQLFFVPDDVVNYVKNNGGLLVVLKELLSTFKFLYTPVIIFIFLELIKNIAKNEKFLKIHKIITKICFVCSIMYYLWCEFLCYVGYSVFSNSDLLL